MCFTIANHLGRKAIENRFRVDSSALMNYDYAYFYNAFSHPRIPVITMEDPNRIQLLHWGLIPSWSRNREDADRLRKLTLNAKAETLAQKPSFRTSLEKGRCLVLAGGFYEWQHLGAQKIPWFIYMQNHAPFAFAGLYDQWKDPEGGEEIKSFSIITTRANPLMEKIHNTKKRMPAILPGSKENSWLDKDFSPSKSSDFLLPFPENELMAHTISQNISSKNIDPTRKELIDEVSYPLTGKLF